MNTCGVGTQVVYIRNRCGAKKGRANDGHIIRPNGIGCNVEYTTAVGERISTVTQLHFHIYTGYIAGVIDAVAIVVVVNEAIDLGEGFALVLVAGGGANGKWHSD